MSENETKNEKKKEKVKDRKEERVRTGEEEKEGMVRSRYVFTVRRLPINEEPAEAFRIMNQTRRFGVIANSQDGYGYDNQRKTKKDGTN